MVDKLHFLPPATAPAASTSTASASSAANEQHLARLNRASSPKYKGARSGGSPLLRRSASRRASPRQGSRDICGTLAHVSARVYRRAGASSPGLPVSASQCVMKNPVVQFPAADIGLV